MGQAGARRRGLSRLGVGVAAGKRAPAAVRASARSAIRQARLGRGLSQAQLAADTGLRQSVVSELDRPGGGAA
ncbi:helix-turn-helix domain-containing protein [Leucobacter sp. BZR 635]